MPSDRRRGDDFGSDAARDRRRAVRGRRAGLSGLDRARAACREAIEKVSELCARVRTAVDGSLGEVDRAVPREQQRQTEQVEALQQRIEACRRRIAQLAEHVTRLGADYRTLAATLRGSWD